MKYLVLIPAFFLLASPACAQETAVPAKIVILRTTSEQRALTEVLSARIKTALLGERYVLENCQGKNCGAAKR